MEMQEKKLKRFNVYRVITKVLFILSIIAIVLFVIISALVMILLLVRGPEVLDSIQRFLHNQGFEYTLPISQVPYIVVLLVELSTIIGIVLTSYILHALTGIFKNIVDARTPFIPDNNKKVRYIGISLLIYTFIQFILSTLLSFEIGRLFDSARFIRDGISVNWTMVGFGILVLALAEIFEFGSSLQQDNQSIV